MTLQSAQRAALPLTEQLVYSLQQLGLEVEGNLEGGAVAQIGDHSIFLEAERGHEGEVLVRAHMPLDIYVEVESLTDSLMGLNMMNQTLDFGMLLLSPVEEQDEASGMQGTEDDSLPTTFAIVGRTVLWLSGTSAPEVQRLSTHLHRFEAEVFSSLESAVNSAGAMSA